MTGIAQRLEADWDHLTARIRQQAHHTSAAQAAASTTQPEEQPMSTPSPFDGFRHFIDAAEHLGIDTFDRVQRIAGNPYTLPALEWLDTLSGGHIPAEVLVKTLGAIEGLHLAYPKPAAADNGQQTA